MTEPELSQRVRDSMARREFRELLDRSSLGNALNKWLACTSPTGFHIPQAEDKDRKFSKCLGCDQRIKLSRSGANWVLSRPPKES